MKYDPIELMKLDITEETIQKWRDSVLRCLTVYKTSKVVTIFPYTSLPFIIDMFEGYEINIEPAHVHGCVFGAQITITLK